MKSVQTPHDLSHQPIPAESANDGAEDSAEFTEDGS
jgi:hypothetical protein